MENVGITVPQYHFDSLAELTTFGQRVDELGFDSLWVGESWGRDAVGVLSYLASVTETVELGSAIVNVFSRTPTQIGMAFATLDELSGGRVNLGIGTSNPKIIEDWHGESFERPLAHEADVIRVVTKMVNGETLDYSSDLRSLSDFRLRTPIVRSHVPTYVAALGPKNRRLTGELADGWMPHNLPFPAIEEAFAEVETGAERADRDPGDIEVAPYVPTVVLDDLDRARQRIAEHIAYYVGTSELYNATPARYGFESEAREIREHWVADDRAAATSTVSGAMVDSMGVATTPDTARKELRALSEHGVDHAIVKFPDTLDSSALESALIALAPER